MLGDGVSARLSPTGHLVFARDETLWAVLFDPNLLELVGQPVPLLSDVQLRLNDAADFTFANDGTLIYVPTGAAPERVLAWVDRAGDATVIAAESRTYRWPHLSADGTKVLVNVGAGSDQSIWIYDRPRETWMLLTTAEGGTTPMWTLDGTGVVFTRSSDIYSTPADGSGEAILLAISEFPKGRKYLISLSFRGKASVRPAQVGGFDVNIVIHGSTAVRGRGDLVGYIRVSQMA